MSFLSFEVTAWILVAASLGLFSQLVYFIHGEHHTLVVTYIGIVSVIYTVISVGIAFLTTYTSLQALGIATLVLNTYLSSLFTSVLIYRAFFHRLHGFPGPPLAKLGKLWHSSQILHRNNYVNLDEWHTQYGDFVRIGCDEISTIHPNAIQTVFGPKSPCTKGSFYDIEPSKVSVHMTRDPTLHDKRRKVWDQGLSTKSLREYQARIKALAELLADKLGDFGGTPVNMTPWFAYFGFDVMADVAFNKSFNMLKDGREHFAIQRLSEAMEEGKVFLPMAWLVLVLLKIPFLHNKMLYFRDWCKEQADERRKMSVSESDIISHLFTAEPMSDVHSVNEDWLACDARLIVIAGSETSSATLTHIIYHLASGQSQQQNLGTELAGFIQEDGSLDAQSLTNSERLNTVINETLRLHPPVPGGLSRKAPPEGLTIGDTFIPGECIVTVPFWSAQRRKYNCAGKSLALLELRIATAILVTRFDIRLAPREDGKDLFEQSRDRLTIAPGPLRLMFKKRE